MLIAYYPAYYVAHGQHDLKAYVVDYFTTEGWPVGPPWFIWELFFFNIVIALLFPFLKNGLYKLSNKLASLKNKAVILFLIWLLLTWILYVPLAFLFGPYSWTGFGPFDFQKSRVLLYGGYFIFGALAGNAGIFTDDTSFVRKWPLWIILCLLTYAVLTIIPPLLRSMVAAHTLPEVAAWLIYFTLYVASCTLSCIAFLTIFKACIHRSRSWWNSLSANAYGIYLVHYILIVWCQYFLLNNQLPAFIKFVITFGVALSGSWLLVSLLRKQSLIKKYL
ncbi:Acyltransferase family protein [Chitinophaga rupis]|uniref:Acyltransferase family protein n=2 Tax=Chitinophaga rupis TaxID=573321 RepID=A0A1H7G4Q1_9BACT|nr:Acyltransferase family protein [Chitinophaga rupis]